MTPDSLVAALRAVPLLHEVGCAATWPTATSESCACCPAPNYFALAAAVREWIRQNMPARWNVGNKQTDYTDGYNAALADVARGLGI